MFPNDSVEKNIDSLTLFAKANAQYEQGEPIHITFTLKNESGNNYMFQKSNTPFGASIHGSFDVFYNNEEEPLVYDGVFLKLNNAYGKNYAIIKAGESLHITLDLTQYFTFHQNGCYQLRLNKELNDIFILEKDTCLENDFEWEQFAGADNFFVFDDDKELMVRPEEDFSPAAIRVENAQFTVTGGGLNRMTTGETHRNNEKLESAKRALTQKERIEKMPATFGDIVNIVPKDPIIINGNRVDTANTKEAHGELFRHLLRCNEDLSRPYPEENGHYQMTFGAYSESRYKKVSRKFKEITDVLSKEEITYEFDYAQGPNIYAYTYKDSRTIYLCPAYARANYSGCDSKIGTIFHELSHAVAHTDDKKYGRKDCRNLAKNNPESAAVNADSYEFFLESVYMYWNGNEAIKDMPFSKIAPKSNQNPAVIVYKDTLYCIYKDADSSALCFMQFDGAQWTYVNGDGKIRFGDSSTGTILVTDNTPGATVYKNLLVIVYNRVGTNDLLYSWFDGNKWTEGGKVSLKSEKNPNAVVFKDKLYIVYKDPDSNSICYAYFDFSSWSPQLKINDVSVISVESDQNPGLVVCGGVLHIVYKGVGSNMLFHASFDNVTWTGGTAINQISDINPECAHAPQLSEISGVGYILHQDHNVTTGALHQFQFYQRTAAKNFFWSGNEQVSFNSNISPFTVSGISAAYFNKTAYTVFKSPVSDDLMFAWQ